MITHYLQDVDNPTGYIKKLQTKRKNKYQEMPSNGFCITYNLLISQANPIGFLDILNKRGTILSHAVL